MEDVGWEKRNKSRTILNKGQLEKNDGNSMVSWKLGKGSYHHSYFIQTAHPTGVGCNEGDSIAFDAWLSLIIFVEMAARMHEVEECGMTYMGGSEDRLLFL